MSDFKLKQLGYETNGWKRLIGFLTDENIHLKTRLSEILKENVNTILLEDVESFQNMFIKTDDLIGLLRNDIAELDNLLVRDIFDDRKISYEIENKLKKLRNNTVTAEKQFCLLKKEFNSYADNIYFS